MGKLQAALCGINIAITLFHLSIGNYGWALFSAAVAVWCGTLAVTLP
jgi:hypothetical protein